MSKRFKQVNVQHFATLVQEIEEDDRYWNQQADLEKESA